MKLIATSIGKLFVGPVPSERDLIESGPFDLIWNLAAEFEDMLDEEKQHAGTVFLGMIRDYSVPTDLVQFKTQVDQVVTCLQNHSKVFVHCAGGRGRTSTAAAIILFYLDNIDIDTCLERVFEMCRGPELPEQIDFVKKFAEDYPNV